MDDTFVFQAFRESPARAAAQVKNLEARLALEAQRCLQLEKQIQVLREDVLQARTHMKDLEARLADAAKRTLQLETQIHDLREIAAPAVPRVEEQKKQSAGLPQRSAAQNARRTRKKV